VEIAVVDVNDNSPQFVQPLYTASVREDIQLGETILKGNSFVGKGRGQQKGGITMFVAFLQWRRWMRTAG
jgi:hypothetical protein